MAFQYTRQTVLTAEAGIIHQLVVTTTQAKTAVSKMRQEHVAGRNCILSLVLKSTRFAILGVAATRCTICADNNRRLNTEFSIFQPVADVWLLTGKVKKKVSMDIGWDEHFIFRCINTEGNQDVASSSY